jgi:hypothetical protein
MSTSFTKAAFANAFPTLRPAILGEWTELDEAALAATGGELDKVVALIAERTAHTKALVRRHLEELYRVVTQPIAEPNPGRPRRARAEAVGADGLPHIDNLIEEFERRTAHVIRELRGGFLDGARDRVKDNVFFSLLCAIGLGFIVGVLFTGFHRGK